MKKVLILTMALIMVASVAFGASIVASKHDLSTGGSSSLNAALTAAGRTTTQVCVFCHTPHQAAAAAGQDPLWNHTVTSTANFGVYASDTLNAVLTDIGGQAVGSQSVSALCMGCHDGTVAVNSLYKAPADGLSAGAATVMITGSALLGTSLNDDHPINFTYDAALATADGGLVTPASLPAAIKLFSGTVQCASCHNVHDPANAPFLRMSNAGSALCLACHTK